MLQREHFKKEQKRLVIGNKTVNRITSHLKILHSKASENETNIQ